MPKANTDPTTGDRVVAPETAAAAVALTAPSILDLGRHLAAVEIAYNAHDCVLIERTVKVGDVDGIRRANRDAKAAQEILAARGEALRNMIVTMPPKTMQDAAVQLGVLLDRAGRLTGFNLPAEKSSAYSGDIEGMARGLLPILATAAGLDMEAMDWRDGDQLRVIHFAGVGVTS